MDLDGQLEAIFNEGLQEKLNELLEDSLYLDYGRLIAEGKLDFDSEVLKDKAEVARKVALFRKNQKKSLDW